MSFSQPPYSYTMDKRQIASWIVPLVGHQFDLEDLPHWLAGQDVHVATRNDTFVLVISSAIFGDNYEQVRAFAEDQLELINGIGRLLSSTFQFNFSATFALQRTLRLGISWFRYPHGCSYQLCREALLNKS